MSELVEQEIVRGLSKPQRTRLIEWPNGHVVFDQRAGVQPDQVAQDLCALGLCTIMPWKHGSQLGVLPLGIRVMHLLKDSSNAR